MRICPCLCRWSRATHHNSKLMLHGKMCNLWFHSFEFILVSLELCPLIHVAPDCPSWLIVDNLGDCSHRNAVIMKSFHKSERNKNALWNELRKRTLEWNIRTRETLCKYTNSAVVLYIRSSLVMALLLLQQQPHPQPPTKWHVMFLCFLYSLPFGSNKLLCGPYLPIKIDWFNLLPYH